MGRKAHILLQFHSFGGFCTFQIAGKAALSQIVRSNVGTWQLCAYIEELEQVVSVGRLSTLQSVKYLRLQWNLQTRDSLGLIACPYLGGIIIH